MRTFDATPLNKLANDPLVRPYLLGEGEIDLNPVASNPSHFVFWYPQTPIGFVFERLDDVITAEVHTIARPGGEFTNILDCAREVVDWVFVNTTVERIYTKVARNNPGARMLANRVGFHNWHLGGSCSTSS
jgi:hypothetical protein